MRNTGGQAAKGTMRFLEAVPWATTTMKVLVAAGAIVVVGCAATVPQDWKRVDRSLFSFYAPPTIEWQPLRFLEGPEPRYVMPNMEMTFNERGPWAGTWGKSILISGLPAQIRVRQERGPSDRLIYLAELYVEMARDSGPPPVGRGLNIHMSCSTKKAQRDAVRLLRSVMVHQAKNP
jgi:hypothetical protein